MKNAMISLAASIAVFFGLALPAQYAEAKRVGGGGSVGMQRSATPPATPPKQAAQPQQAAPAAAGAAQAGSRSWMGPVAGLAAGLGLAALASYLGFGEEMASMLLILLLVVGAFFLYKMLTRNRQPQGAMQYAGAGANGRSEPLRFDAAGLHGGTSIAGAGETAAFASVPASIPAGFDVDGFLRQAKLNFIRLQAANDRGDMDDLMSFLAPEVFAEVQMQYRERGQTPQFTDVAELHVDLLEVLTENGQYIASVHFHGSLREEENAQAQAFREIWHLAKPEDGSFGWRVVGIQQVG